MAYINPPRESLPEVGPTRSLDECVDRSVRRRFPAFLMRHAVDEPTTITGLIGERVERLQEAVHQVTGLDAVPMNVLIFDGTIEPGRWHGDGQQNNYADHWLSLHTNVRGVVESDFAPTSAALYVDGKIPDLPKSDEVDGCWVTLPIYRSRQPAGDSVAFWLHRSLNPDGMPTETLHRFKNDPLGWGRVSVGVEMSTSGQYPSGWDWQGKLHNELLARDIPNQLAPLPVH